VPSKSIDYKKLNSELDTILTGLQSGDLDIDEAVKQYQRGMVIVEELQKYLKEAENKVTKVKADFSA
jgi:exodeoxyribonuclease VII small subunit